MHVSAPLGGRRTLDEPVTSRARTLLTVALALVATALLLQGLGVQREFAERRIGVELSVAESGLRVDGLTPGLPAEGAGVLPGDLLVAIEGEPVISFVDYDRVASSFRPDRPVTLTLDRAGSAVEIDVVPGAPVEATLLVLNAITVLGYLALFVLALSQAADDLRGRLLALFAAAVAIELALPIGLPDGSLAEVLVSSTFMILSGLEMGFELHLASVIPRRASWLIGRRGPIRIYYGIGLAFAAVGVLTEIADATGASALPWHSDQVASVLNTVLLPAWALAVVAILAAQVRDAVSARERQQALLVLIGVLPWCIFTLTTQALSVVGVQAPNVVSGVVQSLALIAYPLAVFVAVFRYRLFDIELVIRRSLVYTTVTFVLAVVAMTMLWSSSRLVGGMLGNDRLPVWVTSVVALTVGLLFAPLRAWVQRVFDARLFPERTAMRARLTELAANLPALGSLPSMGRHLAVEIREIFDVRSATLMVADPRSGILVSLASTTVDLEERADRSLLLGPDDEGVRLLRRSGRLLRSEVVARHSAVLAQRLEQFDAAWALALRSGSTLAGILLLGPKSDRGRFLSEELELLGLFSHTVASVLENARLFESATFERLTGLLRREAVLDLLERESARAIRYRRPLAIGMADIDYFKRVNDQYGHLTGDAVLKLIAQNLASGLRASDSIGRYGGEEFLFVLPETDLAGAVRVAEKLRGDVERLQLPVEKDEPIQVTISIGLAQLNDSHRGEHTVRMLLADADAALLKAKRTGRNRVMPIHAVASRHTVTAS